MASMMFVASKKRWRVRKHITEKTTGFVRRFDLLVKTKPQALQTAADLDRLAKNIKCGISLPDHITDAVTSWLNFMKNRTQRTHDLYDYNIHRFINTLPANITFINQISPAHIYSFISSITEKWTAATANRYLTTVKSFCRWFSRKYSLANPASAVDMLPEPDPDSRFLTQAEYDSIIAIVSDWHRSLFVFIANTGLRASEFCGLRWSDISDNFESLTIRGKGRKRRTIPLNSVCIEILKSIKTPLSNPADPIFISKSLNPNFYGRPLTRGGLYNLCSDYADRLKIPTFGPHAFRHWFATNLLLAGVPIAHVSILLGHSSIATTQRHYIHILPVHLRGITECLAAKAIASTTTAKLSEK